MCERACANVHAYLALSGHAVASKVPVFCVRAFVGLEHGHTQSCGRAFRRPVLLVVWQAKVERDRGEWQVSVALSMLLCP